MKSSWIFFHILRKMLTILRSFFLWLNAMKTEEAEKGTYFGTRKKHIVIYLLSINLKEPCRKVHQY